MLAREAVLSDQVTELTREEFLKARMPMAVVCRVRLLRESGDVAYATEACTWRTPGGQIGGDAAPIRFEGGVIKRPEDGAGLPGSVRRLFPTDIARALLGPHASKLYPEKPRLLLE